ncbi:hypothetical protein TUZN_1546 [Thermoproteus uzoniensis 768-20]|uniref:Lrp/AsnC family transcriptional regulator n=1 Tax=Thermoproteus uzoniensis (strain 768-20) TaxID=999630 RepID=F2L287_THEU7|nr:hypothetical protein [Thermoproteus uzoniensis]AEA13014.1 hypothetical protein TUZN_1546 [Thermoproteus uzoniensis 768-20]
MEVLILVSHLGWPDEVSSYISKAPGVSEVYSSQSGYIVARARVESPSDLRELLSFVRRCRGVLRVEYMVARRPDGRQRP